MAGYARPYTWTEDDKDKLTPGRYSDALTEERTRPQGPNVIKMRDQEASMTSRDNENRKFLPPPVPDPC